MSLRCIYLPPDGNCLLSVADHCLRSVNCVNAIVADKQVHLQYLDLDMAIAHCTKGAGIWDWASNDQESEPDVVMASCGDVPTMESLAAAALLRQHPPDIKVQFVNVVDLFKLVPRTGHSHGMTGREFEAPFTSTKPETDRFSLAIDAIDRIPRFSDIASGFREALLNEQIKCKNHAYEFGIDRKDITDWKWPF